MNDHLGDNWPATDWTPPGWWGEVPEWPDREHHRTLPAPRVSPAAVLFGVGAAVLVTVVVGYQIIALAKGWVR